MPLQFICDVPNAAPCTYDSRFNPDLKTGEVKGKIKRQYRHVKRGAALAWVGFESRKKFRAGNAETVAQNERDKKMLINKLKGLGIEGIPEDAPLHHLGKTYNFYDPRMAHVRRKHGYAIETIPILGTKAKAGKPSDDTDEKASLQAQCKERGIDFHHAHGIAKLKELLAED